MHRLCKCFLSNLLHHRDAPKWAQPHLWLLHRCLFFCPSAHLSGTPSVHTTSLSHAQADQLPAAPPFQLFPTVLCPSHQPIWGIFLHLDSTSPPFLTLLQLMISACCTNTANQWEVRKTARLAHRNFSRWWIIKMKSFYQKGYLLSMELINKPCADLCQ